MSGYNKTMKAIGEKLGIGNETKILSKAAEYERLLQTKNMAINAMSDTCKVVICLDLAAALLNTEFDLKSAIKYTNLRQSAYMNHRKTIENILQINNQKLTVSGLCVAMQCASAMSLADKMLREYQTQSKKLIDMSLPQYACMAVYHACRLSKVKVSKSKLMGKCNLKPAQWTKLDADWSKFVAAHFANVKKAKANKERPANGTSIYIDDEKEISDVMEIENKVESVEPYEDWKKRILEMSYRELEQMELNTSPSKRVGIRKSPRKTPQKFPYSIPKPGTPGRGVRALFV